MTTILVTGGAGFIGSHFIKHILKKYPNYKIVNLDKLTYCGNLENLKEIENNPNYKFVLGDICDKNLAYKLIKTCDWVINFAAETHVDNSIKNADNFIRTNIEGTYNLLQSAKELKIKKFLQISTDEVYGSCSFDSCFFENSPMNPTNPYAASKASADLLCLSYFKTYNLPILITRSSNNYGPFQYIEKLIPFFISKLIKGEKVPVYGDGKNKRDWLYVEDNCEAIDCVLHNGKIGEIYNIAAGNERTNLEITNIILNYLGLDKNSIEYVADRLAHDKKYTINFEKIKLRLGWKAKMDFDEGIKKTIQWYLDNKDWINSLENKFGVNAK